MLEKTQGKDELNLCCQIFLSYKHYKIKVNTKSVTDFEKCAVKNIYYFSKKFKGISCPEHLFLALMKKNLAWDSLQARLVEDGKKAC